MIRTLLACQFAAPLAWMNLPSLYSGLKVLKIEDEPGGTATYEGIPGLEGCEDDVEETWPPTTNIEAQYNKGRLDITINSDTNELMGCHDSNGGYPGSGMIGVMLFGIPGTIIASPLILASWSVQRLVSLCTGKHMQHWIIYRKLKGQLPTEVAKQLDTALSK